VRKQHLGESGRKIRSKDAKEIGRKKDRKERGENNGRYLVH
jgi:hypothetical protein